MLNNRPFNLPEKSFQADFSAESKLSTGSTTNKNLVALGLLGKTIGLPENHMK